MIATSVEQSKHLMELGIPKESADMYYTPLNNMEYPWVWQGKPLLERGGIPAWSLSALLELMPEEIVDKEDNGFINNIYYLTLYKCEGEWLCLYEDGSGNGCYEIAGITPIEAACRMVIQLKENNKI